MFIFRTVVVMGIHVLGTLGYYMFLNNIMGTLKKCYIVFYFETLVPCMIRNY